MAYSSHFFRVSSAMATLLCVLQLVVVRAVNVKTVS